MFGGPGDDRVLRDPAEARSVDFLVKKGIETGTGVRGRRIRRRSSRGRPSRAEVRLVSDDVATVVRGAPYD